MIEAIAKLSYLRTSPRKVRLVVDLVRGKKVLKAIEMLTVLNKKAAKPIRKLVESAMANAEHNYKLAKEDLRIVKITVDDGPIIKRWRARARGRAGAIRKRTSHVAVVVGPIKGAEVKKEETVENKEVIVKKEVKIEGKEKKSKVTKPAIAKAKVGEGKKSVAKDLDKK